jgi:MATE family multidrug resistance protein
LKLALPIIGVNVGMMAMGTVDTIMVGRLSPEALAAVALGNVYFFALAILCIGILLALDPVLSQALGAGEREQAALGFQRGLLIAGMLSVPVAAGLLLAEPILNRLGQPSEVTPLAGTYCLILIPGVLPFLMFNACRQTLQAMHRVGPVLWTILIANVANVILNYWLIHGGLGVPALGVAGSAWATSVARFLLLGTVFWLARRELGAMVRPWRNAAWEWRPLLGMMRLGLPIGIQLELELAAFSTVALLMGTFGTVPVAGHQIAINLASLTFMVPMGIGMGAAVLVGNAIGRADQVGIRASARAAILCGVGFMSATALAFLVLPLFLAQLYTNDLAVVAFAAALLPVAGVFQVFDGIQVVCAGILRGMGDTRTPMLVSLVGFAVIGVTASILLGFYTPLGPVGLWWGLVIGLVVVAAILLLRVRVMIRRPLIRITTG